MKRIELNEMFKSIESRTALENSSEHFRDLKCLQTETFVLLPLKSKPFEVLELDGLDCLHDKDGLLYALTDCSGAISWKGSKYAIHDPWDMNEIDADLRRISIILADRLVVLDLKPDTGEVLQIVVYGRTINV